MGFEGLDMSSSGAERRGEFAGIEGVAPESGWYTTMHPVGDPFYAPIHENLTSEPMSDFQKAGPAGYQKLRPSHLGFKDLVQGLGHQEPIGPLLQLGLRGRSQTLLGQRRQSTESF